MKKIYPCLWFDHQAEEAAKFYSTVFSNSKIGNVARYGESMAQASGRKAGSVMTVEFSLEDLSFLGLNAGPLFKFSPSLSFFVSCDSEKEITEKWQKLSAGGQVRMGLDRYPWAEKYGWTTDRFGVDWQLILTPRPQKIVPAFLFVDSLFGKGEEAIKFYTSIFKNSKIENLVRDEATQTVMHCSFTLDGQGFALMEGKGEHHHTFTHATSIVVSCNDQTEIDYFWDKLSAGGSIEQCGWLQDKYGVSWQITPSIMNELMTDRAKSEKVMKAMLKMKKLDIARLKQAAAE